MFKKYLPFLASLIALTTLTACGGSSNEENNLPYRQTEFTLGSFATLQIHTPGKEDVLETAFNRIFELEHMLTVNDPSVDSEVERINQMAGIEPVQVSDEVFNFIQKAFEYTEKSNGSFNIAIGPLTKLWNINFDNARRPDQEEIDAILPLLNYEHIVLDPENKTVFLEEEGMRFDFGGIAKGFVADEIYQLFRDNGVDSAIIDLSGDVFALGESPRGRDWIIGIQNPHSGRGNTMAQITVNNQVVFTSGVYERYVVENGESFHHILDPKTGFPFDTGIVSLTIVADSGFQADAYSTIAFGKGIEEGLPYIEAIEGVDAMFIDQDNNVFITSGLRDILTIQDEDFTLSN